MAFKFGEAGQKTIPEILTGTQDDILANIKRLRADYLEKTGEKLDEGCRPCLNKIITGLKKYYGMETHFKFKRAVAQYKNRKGDKTAISNSNLTDEKAIEFLRTNPDRISLFSEYPENWRELIEDTPELPGPNFEERQQLMEFSLKELREMYPETKAASKEAFINKVLKE